MKVSGQWFGAGVVARIDAAVTDDPSMSRSELARRVCDWLGWHGPDGKPRVSSCRTALVELQRRRVIQLPPARCQIPRRPNPYPDPETGAGCEWEMVLPPIAEFTGSLTDLGPVEVVLVAAGDREMSKVWDGFMARDHYLGVPHLRGARLRYLLTSPEHGLLGAFSFDACSRALTSRDKWIGWSHKAREWNLQRVVCNSRFLIGNNVQVKNLASWALAQVLGRLAGDWSTRYGYEPVLVETFVDPKFSATAYRAANWVAVGRTAGRTDGFANGKVSTGPKNVYCYPLRPDFKDVLQAEPVVELVARDAPLPGGDWVDNEFAAVDLSDRRLRDRLGVITRDFFAQPGESITTASGGSAARSKGVYRFLNNGRVNMDDLLRPHVEATAARMKSHDVVLAVQDTTSLNYTTHRSATGFGPINTTKDSAVGLLVHDTMAFDTTGTPLGLLDVQAWARPDEPRTKTEKNQRAMTAFEDKESFKWVRSYRATAQVQKLCPDTRIVSVADREGDIHQLFAEAQSDSDSPDLLIRSARNRRRRVLIGDEHQDLWEKLATGPVVGTHIVQVPRSGNRPARTATLEVRHEQVTLRPPNEKKIPKDQRQEPVTVWAVYAKETDVGPDVKNPLEWMLLTTVAVDNTVDAIERLHWYTLRWGIEVYHRVIKSGCRIQDRQLGTAESTQACLAIDMVVGWRIFFLTQQARTTPDTSSATYLEADQWRALSALQNMTNPNAEPTDEPPTMRDAVRMIAALGGFLGRKGDGEPGTTTIWRGLQKLEGIIIGYRMAQQEFRQRQPVP